MLLKFIFFTSFILSVIVMALAQVLSSKEVQELEKPSPFECGFFSKNNSWTPFSMHFFLSALIFLIFDIEIVLLFPYLMLNEWKIGLFSMILATLFLAILSIGFFFEWSQKFLEWSK